MALYGTPIPAVRGPTDRPRSDYFTIAGWIKLNGALTNTRDSWIGRVSPGGGTGWIVFDHTSAGTSNKYLWYSGTTYHSIDIGTLTVGVWNHVVMRRRLHPSAGLICEGYTNGVWTGGFGAPLNVTPGTNYLQIQQLHGAMCDVVYWNRAVDLNYTQILTRKMSAALQHQESIVDYFPLIRDPMSIKGNFTTPLSGSSIGYSDHPVLVMP